MRLSVYANRLVLRADYVCSALQVGVFDRPGYLVTIFIHGLFLDEREVGKDLCYPQQRITLRHLEEALASFRRAGYGFVSPDEILDGLDPAKRHCLLTFDDGYFNNQRALRLMEEFDAPAVFFVPAEPVETGKGYWWDHLYRFRLSQGMPSPQACSEICRRVRGRSTEIEEAVLRLTGGTEFAPISDIDRGFTVGELREFAAHPKVHIGNHGYGHEFLTYYSPTEAREHICRAQRVLESITGKAPVAIAYPVGGFSPELVETCMEAGLRLGFTTSPTKTNVRHLSDPHRRMLIGRFALEVNPAIPAQCKRMRSDLALHYRYEKLLRYLKRFLRKRPQYPASPSMSVM